MQKRSQQKRSMQKRSQQKRSWLTKSRRLANQHQTKIRFFFAGTFNTAIALAVYPAIYYLAVPLKLHYLTVLAVGYVVTVTCSFLTNKFFVFRTSGNYLRESGKFLMLHLSYFLVNLAALPVLVEFAGINPVWAQTLFAVLVVVTSYFWHSRITFSSTKVTK